jgi:hypothetical protein
MKNQELKENCILKEKHLSWEFLKQLVIFTVYTELKTTNLANYSYWLLVECIDKEDKKDSVINIIIKNCNNKRKIKPIN